MGTRLWGIVLLCLLLTSEALAKEPYCNWSATKAEVEAADKALYLTAEERRASIKSNLPWGVPVPPEGATRLKLRVLEEYIALYDSDLLAPLWTAHRLRRQNVVEARRKNAFRQDPLLLPAERSSCADYKEPTFDQGHLVPRADMNRSSKAMLNTFLMTNITPQHAETNRGAWRVLEEWTRAWAVQFSTVWVITGALYDHSPPKGQDPDHQVPRMWSEPLGQGRVGVPSHLYKIVLRETTTGMRAIAFLVPNSQSRPLSIDAHLRRSLVSIDNLESLTGFWYLPELRAKEERRITSLKVYELW